MQQNVEKSALTCKASSILLHHETVQRNNYDLKKVRKMFNILLQTKNLNSSLWQ